MACPEYTKKRTVHAGKLPAKTLAILEGDSQQIFPGYPYRLFYVNALPEIFTIYHNFLYENVLFSHHADLDQDFADNGRAVIHEDAEWSRLAQSYLLGLRLEDERFCNAVVDGLVEKMAEVVCFFFPSFQHSDIVRRFSYMPANGLLIQTKLTGPLPDRHRC